jgi:hypothetical protein
MDACLWQDKEMSKSVFDILKGQKQLRVVLRDVQVANVIQEHWVDIFKKLARDLHFMGFQNGTLMLGSRNPAWVHEIHYYRETLLKRIRSYFPKLRSNPVTRIRIQYDAAVVDTVSDTMDAVIELGDLPLDEKIHALNAHRRAQGWQMCPSCKAMLVPPNASHCAYCG